MLIENNRGAPESPTTRGKPSNGDSQRWLAELEREFLQATETTLQDVGRSTSGSTADSSAPAARTAAGQGGAPDRAADDDRRAAAVRAPLLAAAQGPTPIAAGDAAAIAAPAALAVPAPDRRQEEPCIDSTAGMRVGDTAPESVALPPSITAGRQPGPGAAAEPAGTPGRPFAAAPRYARRLMSLTEGEHTSATIRDASLSPADSEGVARSVSLQLQAAGLGVQRVFINGQRFDSTPTGVVPRPGRLQPLFQDDTE